MKLTLTRKGHNARTQKSFPEVFSEKFTIKGTSDNQTVSGNTKTGGEH